jgi:hypothetical protein
MAPSSKHNAASKDRRKSGATAAPVVTTSASPSNVVTLKVTPTKLRAIVDPDFVKEETPIKDSNESTATSTTLPAAPNSNTENASDSNPNTPAAGTPAPQSTMGPPAEGPKKKGPKRGAAAMNGNGEPKVRGKPGPKKKQRL